jgi:hypothetical protein
MKDDPAIAAIREARHKISASVDHDPRRLVEHYRKLQQRHRDRLVSRHAEVGEASTEPSTGNGAENAANVDPAN